jgi:hypothetical protein
VRDEGPCTDRPPELGQSFGEVRAAKERGEVHDEARPMREDDRAAGSAEATAANARFWAFGPWT